MKLHYFFKESNRLDILRTKDRKFILAALRRYWPYIKARWKSGLSGSLFMIVLALLALPSPYLIKLIFDKVLIARNIGLLNLIIILLIGIQLVRIFFSVLTSYHFSHFSQEVMANIKKDLFYRILRLPLSFFDKNQTGYILSRIGEVEGLSYFFSSIVASILISLLELIFCLTILFLLSWKLTIISLFIIPLFFFITKFFSKTIRNLSLETYEKGAEISHHIQDSLAGVDVIKYFSAERKQTLRIHSFLNELRAINIKRNVISTFSSESLALIGALGGVIVLWYSGVDIIKGSFTVGSYMAFSAYVAKLYGPTQMLASIGLAFQPAITALCRVSELMEIEGEEKRDNGIAIQSIRNEIEFRNVSFSYDTKKVLCAIDLVIKKGEKVILTGPNGSGKSTLVKLILGLYESQDGSIFIDGLDIKRLSLSSLRDRISVVSQNTFLFNDTIKNNILYSRPEASEEEMFSASRIAGAFEFIRILEKGYETIVGERGVKLSGGERQKISIARAILRDADVMIFDEATVYLDQESEKNISFLFQNGLQNKTCIIVSQHVHNIPQIKKIYYMNEGRISHVETAL